MGTSLNKRESASAFTLVELLCVVTIIGILAGLMLGPIARAHARARDFKWQGEYAILMNDFRDRLANRFAGQKSYPAFSADALYENGIIDLRLHDFLKDKRVEYFPFSSIDPDEMVILKVSVSKNSISYFQKNSLMFPARE